MAGLAGDWDYTGGCIYLDDSPDMDSYTYLMSNHACPEIDGDRFDCYIYDSEAKRRWPNVDLSNLK
jgi:hypothetical protein